VFEAWTARAALGVELCFQITGPSIERRDEKGQHFDPEWIAEAAYRQAASMLLVRAT
jgi:hypothetical protein